MTYSSYLMHCLVNLLLQKDILVHKLRQEYEIWLIPMLNPDGVVVGNTLGNIFGKDIS